MEIVKLAKKYGEKECTICKAPYSNTHQYFYRDRTAKDGLRCNCIKCEDRKQKNKAIIDLRETTEYKTMVVKNREIQELKRTVELQKGELSKSDTEIACLRSERNTLKESAKTSKNWNKCLAVCLALWIIGSWVIMLM